MSICQSEAESAKLIQLTILMTRSIEQKGFLLCFLKLPNMKRMQAKCLSKCDGLMMSRWPLSFISRCHVWCYDSHFEASRFARSKTVCSKWPLPDIHKRRDLNILSCLIKHLNHWYSGIIASIFKCKVIVWFFFVQVHGHRPVGTGSQHEQTAWWVTCEWCLHNITCMAMGRYTFSINAGIH